MSNINKKSTLYKFNTVDVVWANLAKADEFRGQTKHDISFVISEEIKSDMMSQLPANAEIKGVRVGDKGDIIAKAKTTVFTKQGIDSFEKIYDATPAIVKVRIGRGDVVNVNVSLYNYDANLYTILLNAVQLIEKNPDFADIGSSTGTGFEAIEGGYVGSTTDESIAAPSQAAPDTSETPSQLVTDQDMPF
jgi:hypothetical protein